MKVKKFIVHKSPDIDCLTALWLMLKFGNKKFQEVEKASIEYHHINDVDGEKLEKEGIIALDIGKWRFDHHNLLPDQENLCATILVAKYLGIDKHPALKKLLTFVQRKDVEGRGVISKDYLDQVFHFSAFVDNLNELYPNNPHKVQIVAFELLDAHYLTEQQWVYLLSDIKKAKNIHTRNGKIVYLRSNSYKAPKATRYLGFDVCIIENTQIKNIAVQWNSKKFDEETHKKIVRKTIIYLRFMESFYRGEKIDIQSLLNSELYLDWFLHSNSKFILYGSVKNPPSQNSKISREYLMECVAYGLDSTRRLPGMLVNNSVFKKIEHELKKLKL